MEPETLAPFPERAEALLSKVFRGMHHVNSLLKYDDRWTCVHYGGVSTYDFDEMTRLVFAAHEYCCRVEISQGGPRGLKIFVSDRNRGGGNTERHPTIEEALDRWKNKG